MAELVDAPDLKSVVNLLTCGFKSRCSHEQFAPAQIHTSGLHHDDLQQSQISERG